MIFYTFCDEDDHPIAEGRTKDELAYEIGITPNSVYRAYKRGDPRFQVVEDIQEADE